MKSSESKFISYNGPNTKLSELLTSLLGMNIQSESLADALVWGTGDNSKSGSALLQLYALCHAVRSKNSFNERPAGSQA